MTLVRNAANQEKAQWVFQQAFEEFEWEWVGPEFDFDRDAYKARVQSGPAEGKLLYLSSESLEDQNVSALQLKTELLARMKELVGK